MRNPQTVAADLVGDVTGDTRLILNPSAPLEIARELVRRHYLRDLTRTLHHQNGTFFTWRETHYAETADEEIRAAICRFLDGAQRIDGRRLVAFDPTPRHIADVVAMLRAETQLPGAARPPAWLDRQPHAPAAELFACANGLLHLPSGAIHPHTPLFFGLGATDYAYDPAAGAPREWLAFLDSIWPGDAESISAMQEVFGYLLTGDTALQKAFLIVGPPRSGKGTIARVLTGLLGAANVAGPTLAGLSATFGLAALIGKPLAIISDARLSVRADHAVIAERLLSITGEDTLTIDRKYREPWTGRLPTRFMVLTNELPRLSDASGALSSRFVLFQLRQDFRGRENPGLTARLLTELPAILNWAMTGRARLAARGWFVQSAAAAAAAEALMDLASPVAAFLRDRAATGAGLRVECDTLFAAWLDWCRSQGRVWPGSAQTFSRNLRAAVPALEISRPRAADGGRGRCYEGVGLATPAAAGGG